MPSKIYRSSVTSKLLDDFDDPLPGILASTSSFKQDIPSALIDYLQTGWYSRAEKYYRYGKDYYARGLPSEVVTNTEINNKEIINIISSAVGTKILLIRSVLNENSQSHYVRQFLQDVRHMDYLTNEIPYEHRPPGLYLVYAITYIDYVIIGDTFKLNYTYVSSGETFTYYEILPIEFTQELIYQVEYKKLNEDLTSQEEPFFWMYEQGEGTYPILDIPAANIEEVNGRYYPIVPFYEDKLRIGDPDDAGTALYDTSKKLVKKLGFDYQELSDSLAEGAEDTIGKNKGLWAYLYLAVEITAGIPRNYDTASSAEYYEEQKKNQAELAYLVEFFLQEQQNSIYNKSDYARWFLSDQSGTLTWWAAPNYNSFTITDGSFKSRCSYLYIDISYKEGNIGDIGWYASSFVPLTVWLGNFDSAPLESDQSSLFIRKQLEFNLYLEIEIKGFNQQYEIKDALVFIPIISAFYTDPDKQTLITIPLDRTIVKTKLPNKFRNRLIHASIYLVFNSYLKADVKWYQTGFARFIFTVIAMYLAIPSGGSSFTWLSLLTVAGLKAAAYALLISYIKYLIFKELVKFIAKEFGVGAAFVFSMVLMAYGKLGTSKSFKGLPWASDLLAVGNNMWSASNQFLQDKAKEIQEEFNRLGAQEDVAQKELDRAQKLLDVDADLNPWLFVNPLPDLMFSQDADTFINTRIHVSNPGVAALSSPSNYVELMLTLPTIDDTLTK